MFSSLCEAGEGRAAVKKLWPAALLLSLSILLVLYNFCPSCNSEVLWLSIKPLPAAASSSFIISPDDSSSPVSGPVSFPEPQLSFSNDKLGEDDANRTDTGHASTDNSTLKSEVFNSRNTSDVVRADETAQNGSHDGELHTPLDPHAGVSYKSGDGSPKVFRTQKPPPSAAKRGNTNAVRKPAAAGINLRSQLYHNLSMFIKSYELMEKTFKIYTYREGLPPLVHTGPNVGIYASEGRFINQLRSNKHFTTSDPNKAHLFFMPYSVTNMVTNIYVRDSHDMHPLIHFIKDYVDLIASKYSFWNRSHGADHFFVSCHDWGPATTRKNADLRHNAIKVVCNADETEEFVVGKDVSLPETNLHAVKPPTRLGGLPASKRPYLAFFAGQLHGRVRPILLHYLKGKDPDMKIFERLPRAIARKAPYERHMRMSKFCICPMGYEVNSPRIVEAIYYDCVPVIIADNFVLPFSDVLDWPAFSVSMAEQDVPRLKQVLLSIPAAKYVDMQANLKYVRQHFEWHYKLPVKYDVFHMILHSLWLRQQRHAAISVEQSL